MSQEINFLADEKAILDTRWLAKPSQGLKSLTDSLSHLKMTRLSIP
ncbi:hypothetical protein [Okeania sp. SIO1I7]|nr:hypothetical protein [Okeania sp. SIO1I7]NET29153.1 hypothetical protein [Okeania sp. SIO1I7]